MESSEIIEKLKSDKGVKRKLDQLGTSHTLLTSADFKEKVKKGNCSHCPLMSRTIDL